VRRSRYSLDLLGAVLLITLHMFMVETMGSHQHAPPVPATGHSVAQSAVHADLAGDEGAGPVVANTEVGRHSPLACLAILAAFVVVRAAVGTRGVKPAVPLRMLPAAPVLAPRTPPPVEHGILRI